MQQQQRIFGGQNCKMDAKVAVILSLLSHLITVYQLNNLLLCLSNMMTLQRKRRLINMLLSPVHIMHKPSRVTKAKARRFWVRPGRTAAWWQNFVDGKVIDEEWRENFRMDKDSFYRLVVPSVPCGCKILIKQAKHAPAQIFAFSSFSCRRKGYCENDRVDEKLFIRFH